MNAVALGVIKTPMHPVETYAPLGALHPLGRMGEISDIVDAILCLESASFVTGEVLHWRRPERGALTPLGNVSSVHLFKWLLSSLLARKLF